MSRDGPNLHLHVGVHKTATTHIQNVLEHNNGRIAAEGRWYWSLSRTRPIINSYPFETAGPRGLRSRLKHRALQGHNQAVRLRLARLVASDRDTTLSDENILGHPQSVFEDILYPEAGERVRMLADTTGSSPITLWLAIRDYAPFLSSIVAKSLRHGAVPDIQGIAETYRQGLRGGWPDLVSRLREAVPGARFVIWKYEDFKAVEREILSGLSGLGAEEIQIPTRERTRPSASNTAIRNMIESTKPPTRQGRIQKMLALEHTFPRQHRSDSFQLFGAAKSRELSRHYEKDCDEIRTYDNVRFLSPHDDWI